MAKIKLLLLIFFSIYSVSGIYASSGFLDAKPVNLSPSLGSLLQTTKASEFVKLSVRDYTFITGKKMSLFEKLSFKIIKRKMKHDLKKNPKLLITDYYKENKTPFKFNFLWFLIGLFGLAPIGLIIAYLTKQDRDKILSAWIGTGVIVILGIILIAGGGIRFN